MQDSRCWRPHQFEGGIKAVEQLIRESKNLRELFRRGYYSRSCESAFTLWNQGAEEVAVTGYNNSEYAKICEPQLTTIDNKPELVAMMSVQLLTSLIEKTEVYS